MQKKSVMSISIQFKCSLLEANHFTYLGGTISSIGSEGVNYYGKISDHMEL